MFIYHTPSTCSAAELREPSRPAVVSSRELLSLWHDDVPFNAGAPTFGGRNTAVSLMLVPYSRVDACRLVTPTRTFVRTPLCCTCSSRQVTTYTIPTAETSRCMPTSMNSSRETIAYRHMLPNLPSVKQQLPRETARQGVYTATGIRLRRIHTYPQTHTHTQQRYLV